MKTETCKTHVVRIYLSGPLEVIEMECRRFCLQVGLCVTVEPTRFIYTGGEETGAVVGLLNYPRFPKTDAEIDNTALELAKRLLEATAQHSVLIVEPGESIWITKRES